MRAHPAVMLAEDYSGRWRQEGKRNVHCHLSVSSLCLCPVVKPGNNTASSRGNIYGNICVYRMDLRVAWHPFARRPPVLIIRNRIRCGCVESNQGLRNGVLACSCLLGCDPASRRQRLWSPFRFIGAHFELRRLQRRVQWMGAFSGISSVPSPLSVR